MFVIRSPILFSGWRLHVDAGDIKYGCELWGDRSAGDTESRHQNFAGTDGDPGCRDRYSYRLLTG